MCKVACCECQHYYRVELNTIIIGEEPNRCVKDYKYPEPRFNYISGFSCPPRVRLPGVACYTKNIKANCPDYEPTIMKRIINLVFGK